MLLLLGLNYEIYTCYTHLIYKTFWGAKKVQQMVCILPLAERQISRIIYICIVDALRLTAKYCVCYLTASCEKAFEELVARSFPLCEI